MFDRMRVNFLKKWYTCVDRQNLSIVFSLLVMSNVFVALASPIVASRVGVKYNLFIIKNLFFTGIASVIVIAFSFFDDRKVTSLSFYLFLFLFIMMVLVMFYANKNKGARRWLYFFGISIQPSEIIKPFFVVIVSYILTEIKRGVSVLFAMLLYMVVCALLLLQPDLGMVMLMTMTMGIELFLTDIHYKYFLLLGLASILSIATLYLIFPHFNHRVSTYIDSTFFGGQKSYQIEKSLDAFSKGGVMGTGPFGGIVKNYIPDAHTDFIFSVVGEEFGGMICIVLISIYFYITIRSSLRVIDTNDCFIYVSAITLGLQFLMHALVNICSALNLLPTKGMTLPLISYGGSSMLGSAITLGFLFSLTRQRYGKVSNSGIVILNCYLVEDQLTDDAYLTSKGR